MIADIFKRRTLKKQSLDRVWDDAVPELSDDGQKPGHGGLPPDQAAQDIDAANRDSDRDLKDSLPEDKIVTLEFDEEGETLLQESLAKNENTATRSLRQEANVEGAASNVRDADEQAPVYVEGPDAFLGDKPGEKPGDAGLSDDSKYEREGSSPEAENLANGGKFAWDVTRDTGAVGSNGQEEEISRAALGQKDSGQEFSAGVPASNALTTDSSTRGHLEAGPAFRMRPPQAPSGDNAFDRYRFGVAEKRLWDAFTPSQPKRSQKSFAGRRKILERIISAIEEECINVAVFGARGIGKTSIAHVVAEAAKEVDYHVLRFPCSTDTTYEALFRGLLSRIPAENMDRSMRARRPDVTNFAQLLPKDSFGPTDVADAFSHLVQEHFLLIVDEFERIADLRLRGQLMETIKHLSDIGARATFLILGIADSLRELVGDNPLMQRHILGVHLPLMERGEVSALVDLGEAQSGLTFQPQIKNLIVSFSAGLPYFTQLVSLQAACFASRRKSDKVEVRDLKFALYRILNEAPSDLVTGYGEATWGADGKTMSEVLYAAASCQFDRYGAFVCEDVYQVLKGQESSVTDSQQLQACFHALTKSDRGAILQHHSRPGKEDAYIFRNHMMRQYILLRHAKLRNII